MSALNYEVSGSAGGPDLVLLHGWSLNLRVFDGLSRALGGRCRLIAIDLPGHGRSDWDARATTPAAQAWRVHETLAGLTERYTLLGWSLGAQIALDLAAALPAAIERLVLVSATPKFLMAPNWRCGTPRPQLARLVHRVHADPERAVNGFLELAVRGSRPRTAQRALAVLHRALRTQGRARREALTAGLARLREGDLRPALPLVRAPALVIGGQRDRVVRAVASRRLARLLPAARYAEIEGAAHAPFLSHPRQFLRCLGEFLDG